MKKFSKKLFCLMLVAIMVATAIPFGAFADGTDANDQGEGLTDVQDGAGTPDVNAVGDTYTVNVIGAVTASGTTPDPIDGTTNIADALTKAKISGMDIHDTHTGTGYLVDGNKESLASDVYWVDGYTKCICVNISYVLWILKEYAGMDYLFPELDIRKW